MVKIFVVFLRSFATFAGLWNAQSCRVRLDLAWLQAIER